MPISVKSRNKRERLYENAASENLSADPVTKRIRAGCLKIGQGFTVQQRAPSTFFPNLLPMSAFDEKTFHRKFEESFGFLDASEFPPIDWAERKQIEMLFPAYRRMQLKFDSEGGQRSKAVEIDNFSLKTPDGTADLFVNTKLIIEGSVDLKKQGSRDAPSSELMAQERQRSSRRFHRVASQDFQTTSTSII